MLIAADWFSAHCSDYFLGLSGLAISADAVSNPLVDFTFQPAASAVRNLNGRWEASVFDQPIYLRGRNRGSFSNVFGFE